MKNNPVLIEVGFNLNANIRHLFKSLEDDGKSVLLDVSHVKTLDVAALGFLTQAQARLHNKGQTIALIKPSAYLRTWLYITKLHKLFPAFPSLSLANQYLNKTHHSA